MGIQESGVQSFIQNSLEQINDELVVPPDVKLRWCPRCKRSDRFMHLKDRHFHEGRLCQGVVEEVRYEPVNPKEQ